MSHTTAGSDRTSLRSSLLAARAAFKGGPDAEGAERAVCDHLIELMTALEPDLLGVYWAVRSEFNLARLLQHIKDLGHPPLALPYAQSVANLAGATSEKAMEFRSWDGLVPVVKDGVGIPSGGGKPVVPDVVIVPCVGFTSSGYRLGYGGGYFDRWLADKPQVTSVGLAWSGCGIDEAVFGAQPHDVPLSIIVTERGVVGQAL